MFELKRRDCQVRSGCAPFLAAGSGGRCRTNQGRTRHAAIAALDNMEVFRYTLLTQQREGPVWAAFDIRHVMQVHELDARCAPPRQVSRCAAFDVVVCSHQILLLLRVGSIAAVILTRGLARDKSGVTSPVPQEIAVVKACPGSQKDPNAYGVGTQLGSSG